MIKLLFDTPDKIGDETLQIWIDALPDWRRDKAEKIKSRNGRMMCAKSYLMLCQALKDNYGTDVQPRFVLNEHGKPSLAELPDVHFNLSHCHDAALCVVSNSPVGCDVESIRRKVSPSLIDYCMSEDEKKQIAAAPDAQTEFIRLWTMKEALCKLTGEGIGHELPRLLTDDAMQKYEFSTEINAIKGYITTICQDKRQK